MLEKCCSERGEDEKREGEGFYLLVVGGESHRYMDWCGESLQFVVTPRLKNII